MGLGGFSIYNHKQQQFAPGDPFLTQNTTNILAITSLAVVLLFVGLPA